MKIIKRNGAEADFDVGRIETAIEKANRASAIKELNTGQIKAIAKVVEEKAAELARTVTVEEIQDMVELEIMKAGAFHIAQCYVHYRVKRQAERKGNTTDGKMLTLIHHENEEVFQENSNKNPMVNSVMRDYMAGEVSRDLTERMMLPENIVEAHREGIIHFHDSDYFAQPMYNCFSGGTRFITDRGPMPFTAFKDGDTVTVVDLNGCLRKATVRNYGKKRMNQVTFQSGRMTKTVICTPDHRWILKDGSVTTDLKVGDRLKGLVDSTVEVIDDKEKAEAFCIGFAVGDGTDTDEGGCRVRLCGAKTKYRSIFELAGYSISDVKGSADLYAYKGRLSKQNFLEGRVWRFLSAEYNSYVFRGLFAADGAKNSNSISSSDERVMTLIEETCSLAGYYLTSRKEIIHDTNYKRGAHLTTFHFIVRQNENWLWRVKEIKAYRHGEVNAWCVEEPITHSFMLEGGMITGNCCLVNLKDMLMNGTVISGTMIESPHSFSTACNVATQIIAQVASNQYGGQSISLAHLVPFVDRSRQRIRTEVLAEAEMTNRALTEKQLNRITEKRLKLEIERGVQTIQYQVITLMTTNGQAPFLSVFMYLGEVDTEPEKHDLAMIIEEVLRQRYIGVKNETGVWVTPAFPKLLYVLEEDNINEDAPYFYLTQLAAKCTARRLVPDYISEKIMKLLKEDNCFPVMGCRSALAPWKDESGAYKFYGRFNQGVVTINLPDVALSAAGDRDAFWKIFDERLELCFEALMCRHKRLLGTVSDSAPILWQYGAIARLPKGAVIDPLLFGGYSSISLGYAGLAECVFALTGKSHTDPEVKPLALAIMQHMNDACARWKEETDIGFSIYGTPIESTTYKFAKCLQKRFGKVKGVSDKAYITNSYHVKVTEEIDAFTKLKLESEFQALSTGGAISYVEVPNLQNNLDAVISVIRFIYDNIMYAELNTKSDYCQACGFDGEIQIVEDGGKLVWECPRCKNRDQSKMNVARRTCGYIGSSFWGQGRTWEIKERVLHL